MKKALLATAGAVLAVVGAGVLLKKLQGYDWDRWGEDDLDDMDDLDDEWDCDDVCDAEPEDEADKDPELGKEFEEYPYDPEEDFDDVPEEASYDEKPKPNRKKKSGSD